MIIPILCIYMYNIKSCAYSPIDSTGSGIQIFFIHV